ncbi:hypothetical protein BH10BDE1_BH10BDE1_27680 [soil metagenome]
MKSSKSNSEVSHEDEICWELDGGNYSIVDEAILYKGRLYDNDQALSRAIMRARTKHAAKMLATTLMPALLFMVLRRH